MITGLVRGNVDEAFQWGGFSVSPFYIALIGASATVLGVGISVYVSWLLRKREEMVKVAGDIASLLDNVMKSAGKLDKITLHLTTSPYSDYLKSEDREALIKQCLVTYSEFEDHFAAFNLSFRLQYSFDTDKIYNLNLLLFSYKSIADVLMWDLKKRQARTGLYANREDYNSSQLYDESSRLVNELFEATKLHKIVFPTFSAWGKRFVKTEFYQWITSDNPLRN